MAGSVALVGFGIDSVIEALAGGVIVWLFSGGRGSSRTAERRAQQLVAGSYAILVAHIGVEAIRDLAGSHHPKVSCSVALLVGLLANALLGWWWAGSCRRACDRRDRREGRLQ